MLTPLLSLCPLGQSLDFVSPAKQAGWADAFVCRPDEILLGAAVVLLGYQYLPVRLLLWDTESAALLPALLHDMATAPYLEQYLVVVGAPADRLDAVQSELARIRGRRLHAGTYADYTAWLSTRLGPLARIAPDNPVRMLVEPLLCVSATPRPTQAADAVGNFARSRIKKSYTRGQFGEQAFETLFSYAHGTRNVTAVQSLKDFQNAGIDALVQTSRGKTSYDSKTEGYDENLGLELYGNYERRTPGWLSTSEMAALCTLFHPTGDAFIADFSAVKQWALDPASRLPLVPGWSEGQQYKSRVYLAPHADLLAAVPSVHLRLQDWLPEVYGGNVFKEPSKVLAATLTRHSLQPQPLL